MPEGAPDNAPLNLDPNAPPPGGPPATPPASGDPWYKGMDAGHIGFIQTKGWDKLDPAAALAASISSYQEAERFLGAPKDQLLRRPDANNPAAVKAFWEQLGRPASPDQYDFSTVKFQDGTELDPAFVDHMRGVADSLHLPKDTAAAVTAGIVKFMESADASEAAERAAAVQTQMEGLRQNWSTNFEANKFLASQGAAKVGVSEAEFNSLFETPGGASMLEIFRKIGDMSGESRFVNNPGGGTGVMTREQAVSRRDALLADQAWCEKYMAGDADKLREMTGLNTIIASVPDERSYFS